MKIILTGVTGYIGSECLRQCLSHPKVTSVVALTRRPLEESQASNADLSSPKLQVVIQEDFLHYTPEALKVLRGADACIWNLGTVPRKHNTEETTKTAIDYPMAAVEAWNGNLKDAGADPFRFVYVSGAMTERDQSKTPIVLSEFLKLRGDCENRLIATQTNNPATWRTYVCGMGKVWNADQNLLCMLPYTIRITEAAASMIDLALHGGSKQTLSNAEMRARGRQALADV